MAVGCKSRQLAASSVRVADGLLESKHLAHLRACLQPLRTRCTPTMAIQRPTISRLRTVPLMLRMKGCMISQLWRTRATQVSLLANCRCFQVFAPGTVSSTVLRDARQFTPQPPLIVVYNSNENLEQISDNESDIGGGFADEDGDEPEEGGCTFPACVAAEWVCCSLR